MKKIFLVMLGVIFLSLGCARIRVEAPKEPIKLDISMRLDIYQHIQKDIDNIENIVSGTNHKANPGDGSHLRFFVENAYAEEALSPEVEQAALSRRDRRAELVSWQEKGVIGENRLGLVEIRSPENMNPFLEEFVRAENNDRTLIYEAIANKNQISIEDVQKLYAKRLQDNANSGTPIEVLNESTGGYEWRIK